MINIVLLTAPGQDKNGKTEYENWQIGEEHIGSIKCKLLKLSDASLYVLPSPNSYFAIIDWRQLVGRIPSPHVFIHFGGAQTGKDIISRINDILNEEAIHIPTLSYYSLGKNNGVGDPEGIGKIYEDSSSYQDLFALFKSRIKTDKQQTEDNVASTFQLHISTLSLLLDVYEKSRVSTTKLINNIKDVLMAAKEQNIPVDKILEMLDTLGQNKPMISQSEIADIKRSCGELLQILKAPSKEV